MDTAQALDGDPVVVFPSQPADSPALCVAWTARSGDALCFDDSMIFPAHANSTLDSFYSQSSSSVFSPGQVVFLSNPTVQSATVITALCDASSMSYPMIAAYLRQRIVVKGASLCPPSATGIAPILIVDTVPSGAVVRITHRSAITFMRELPKVTYPTLARNPVSNFTLG